MKVTKFHLLQNKDDRLIKLLIDYDLGTVFWGFGNSFWVLLHNMVAF